MTDEFCLFFIGQIRERFGKKETAIEIFRENIILKGSYQ